MKKLYLQLSMVIIVIGLGVFSCVKAAEQPEDIKLRVEAVERPVPILQRWQQKFKNIGAKFPSVEQIKQYFKKWGAYEKHMWDCARGNIKCSPGEVKESQKWLLKRILPIIVLWKGRQFLRIYQRKKEIYQRKKEWKEAGREGVEWERLKQERGEQFASVLLLSPDLIKKLEDLNDYTLRPPEGVSKEEPFLVHWYDVLNISEDASDNVISGEFKRLALVVHPDKKTGDNALFDIINKAKAYGLQKSQPQRPKEFLAIEYK